MVDVKKVTASVKKPIFYSNRSAADDVTNEVVNFNPADNPVFPVTSATIYTIDPFAIFTQEDNSLKVKIPFTRFYRLKYAIEITNVYTNPPTVQPDSFSISKPITAVTESIVVKRLSNGVTTDIKTNIYSQDGSGYIVYNPIINGSNQITGFNLVKNCFPAIVEGIVELYAGDVLTFQHSRTVIKSTQVYRLQGTIGLKNLINFVPPYDEYWNIADFSVPSYDPSVSGESLASVNDYFRANAGFFFEISEITDL